MAADGCDAVPLKYSQHVDTESTSDYCDRDNNVGIEMPIHVSTHEGRQYWPSLRPIKRSSISVYRRAALRYLFIYFYRSQCRQRALVIKQDNLTSLLYRDLSILFNYTRPTQPSVPAGSVVSSDKEVI